MAGSYNHCVDDQGRLRSPMQLNDMLENGGDVYEAVEEMYGMIWWLADRLAAAPAEFTNFSRDDPAVMVEHACEYYRDGLATSPGVNDD